LLNIGFPARKRFEFLAKNIPQKSFVLNIGVGNGYLESLLTNKGAIVSCLDPSDAAIKRIRQQLDLGDRAQAGYSQSTPFPDNSFDYVIMSEVLEHLSDDVICQTLKEIKRILKNGGKFIGTVPADENLQESVTVCPKCSEHFHRWGHRQSFSQETLLSVLSLEFNDVSVQHKLFSDFNQLNWKGKTLAVMKMVQAFLNLKGSTQNLFFIAKKT